MTENINRFIMFNKELYYCTDRTANGENSGWSTYTTLDKHGESLYRSRRDKDIIIVGNEVVSVAKLLYW